MTKMAPDQRISPGRVPARRDGAQEAAPPVLGRPGRGAASVSEEWRPVPGFTVYEVSNLGRVRRSVGGKGCRAGHVLRPSPGSHGYLNLRLCENGVPCSRTVHSLVAEAFHGPRPAGMHVNHRDTDKLNCRADNLEWVTPLENVEHAIREGVSNQRGECNSQARLTPDLVHQIRALAAGEKQCDVAARFGLGQSTVSQIVSGVRWSA